MTILAMVVMGAALSAIPVAGAWAAEPEFEVTKGTFPVAMNSAGNVNGFSFETSRQGEGVVCATASPNGVVTGPKSLSMEERYAKCKVTFAGVGGECGSAEVGIFTALKGTIGYVNKSTQPVGVELEGKETVKSGEEPIFAEFTCTVLGVHFKMQLRGHLIGSTPAKLVEEFEGLHIVYGGTKGKQEITGFEGGPTGQQLKWIVGGEEQGNVSVKMESRVSIAPDKMEIR